MANRYWVGGTGNWSDATNHWSDSSGGAPNASFLPTASDDANFDLHSNESSDAAYTVTIDSDAVCLSLWMSFVGTTKVTITGSSKLSLYKSLKLTGGAGQIIWSHTGTLEFLGNTGTANVHANGVEITSGKVSFNGNQTLYFESDLVLNAANQLLYRGISGDFTNDKTITLKGLNPSIQGSFTFYNLTKTGYASNGDTLTIYSNITVSNVLTVNGNSAINRLLVKSDTIGTQRTITAANVTVTNADFQDIKGAGAGSWNLSSATGGSGDCGGNSDITFTTADDWYWHADTGNWSNYAKWYTATNGGGTQMASTRVPLPQDMCYFDANSFNSGSQTITQDMPRIGGMNWTGATNTPDLTLYSGIQVYGSQTFISAMTVTGTGYVNYYKRGTVDLTFNSLVLNNSIASYSGCTLRLLDNFETGSSRYLYVRSGSTFNANNFNVKCGIWLVEAGTTTVLMGSGTWEITGISDYCIQISTSGSVTITPSTSTIKMTGTLTSNINIDFGNKTFNNFWNSTSGNYYITINSSNTFNNLKIDAGRSVKFVGGTDQNVTSITWEGTDGNLITLNSTNTTPWKISATSGTLAVKYCDIHYSTAEGGATFNALTSEGNVDGGNNTGWDFVGMIEKVLTETIIVSGSILKSMSRSLSESVIVTDVMSAIKIFAKTLTETILISDNMLKSISRTLTETVNVLDTKIVSMSRLLLETITVEDSVSFIRTMNKVLTETIIVTGSLLRTIGKTFTETITTSDTLTKMRTKIKVLTETIVVTHLALLRSISRTFRETIIITSKFKIFLNGLNALWSNKFNKTGSTYTDKYPKKGTDHWSNKY